jgi:hypothetical protein
MLHSNEKRQALDLIVEDLTAGAARIASEGNGLPMDTFKALAQHVVHRLAGYRDGATTAQDIDYLARQFQSVFANLQDYQGEIP